MVEKELIFILTDKNYFVGITVCPTADLRPFKILIPNLGDDEIVVNGRNIKKRLWIIVTNKRILSLEIKF